MCGPPAILLRNAASPTHENNLLAILPCLPSSLVEEWQSGEPKREASSCRCQIGLLQCSGRVEANQKSATLVEEDLRG